MKMWRDFTGSIEASLINDLQSVASKVSQLAQYETFTGNPNFIGTQLQRYTNVTKADVWRVYEKYLKGKAAVILSVATKDDPENIAAPANYAVNKDAYRVPDYGYAGLKYEKPKDSFDRAKMPPSGSNPTVKVPPFWRAELPGGIAAIGSESRELPLVAMTLSIPGGHLLQADAPEKAGLARIFGAMMNEDTRDRSAEAFQTELQKLGSSISVNAGLDEINLSVESLKKNLDKTLALVEERLLRPKFTPAAFNRIKRQMLQAFKLRKSQPAIIASEIFDQVNYGADHIFGINSSGREETVQALTLKDVQEYYDRYITRRGARLSVVGDVRKEEILSKLSFLQKLPDLEVKLPSPPAAPKIEKTKIYFVDVPNAAQTQFRVGYVTGLKYDATGEFYRATLANYPLGGMFSSRLNLNLREDKGWTYGARSGFSGDKYTGTFIFSSGIRSDATAGALREVLNELGAYAKTGPAADELAFTRSAVGQQDALNYETLLQKAGFIMRILEYNLPADFVERQNRILAEIKSDQLKQLAAKWFKTNNVNILLVGDKAKVLPSLRDTGFEIVELDLDGKPLASSASASASGGGRR